MTLPTPTAAPETVAEACEIATINPPAEAILAGALFGEAAQTIRSLMANPNAGAFNLGAATSFVLWPEAGLGITVLTNAQPRGLAEAIALLFGEQGLGDAPVGQPSRDWLAFMQPQMHGLYKPEGEHAGQTPPAPPAPPQPLASYVGRYTNAYYGDAQISLGAGGGTLELSIGATPLRYTLRHWSGDEFVFELMGENAPRGSLSAVRFGPGRMQIEYFGRDLGRGEFQRS